MTKRTLLAWVLVLLYCGCGGLEGEPTRQLMREYSPVLQLFFPGGYGEGPEMPVRIEDLDAGILAKLPKQDEWKRDFVYRRVDIDHYNLISKGANGKLGDDDDIILENGIFYPPGKIYSKHPIKKEKSD